MKKEFLLMFSALFLPLCGAEKFIPVESTFPGEWFLKSIAFSRPQMEKFYLQKLEKLDPYAERARCAELYHRTLEERFVANRIEDAAIEKALNWKKGDFTWHNNKYYAKPGCTSWIIAPDASSTGTCIVQKNRDYTGQNFLTFRLFRAAPGRFKVAVVGDLWSSGAGAVMNEKGLMIVQNDGTSRWGHARKVNVGCTFILRHIAEHCANLEEAAAMLKKFHTSGIVRSASIYLLADLNSGMIFEGTASHHAAACVNFAFEVRANNYLLPGMRNVSTRSRKSFLNGSQRRFSALEFLRSTLLDKGKISPADLTKLARLRDPAMEKEGNRQVCMKYTLASTMFVPDRMFPEYLSVTFVALGPTRHTVFLPVPMGVSAVPESLSNGLWGQKALALAKNLPLDHNKLPGYEKLENKFRTEFFAVREKARKLLLARKRKEAVKLLDDLFRKQYQEANTFLEKLQKECAKK